MSTPLLFSKYHFGFGDSEVLINNAELEWACMLIISSFQDSVFLYS